MCLWFVYNRLNTLSLVLLLKRLLLVEVFMDILTHNPLHLCVHMYVYNGYSEGLALFVLWINLTHVYIAIINICVGC